MSTSQTQRVAGETEIDVEVDRLGALPVAVLSDTMDKLGIPTAVMSSGIVRRTGIRMAGRARTMERDTRPSNVSQQDINPALASAPTRFIDEASPGDVLIIAARGDTSVACIGDNMSTRCVNVGVAGVVVDGCIRDVETIAELGLSVFSRGFSPRSAVGRLVTLSLNEPVICGGVYVCPGDIIIGDSDGVIVIPKARAAEIVESAEKLEANELKSRAFIEAGNSVADAVAKFKVK